ncbi:MAG: class I SAM-dependent methyltransferase, partial [Actinomycetota bacterium]|nr:class I SAM-dependent methyltransferase [Actinomycetota bacterium]
RPVRSAGRAALVGTAKRALRPVAGPLLRRTVELVAVRVLERLAPERAVLDRALAELRGLEINGELLKGDLRSLAVRLDDVGWAVAPGAGLEGVPERFAELRERVNAHDRRIRTLASTPAPAGAASSTASGASDGVAVEPPVDRFDYVGFERRFRGDPETILATLADRYVEVLSEHEPVLDVGCGRGELLSVLAARGVAGRGVDLNAEMVTEARDAGLDVAQGDAIAHLRALPERSLGSIIAIHVVEHLELHALTELLELAATRLVPGGVLVAETPNPTSLIVLGNSYILDPTHVWPLHPSLLTFLCERAGFRDVRLAFHAPAEDYRLPRIDPPDGARWADPLNDTVDRLNLVLFGPQEYSVTATTPPLPASVSASTSEE